MTDWFSTHVVDTGRLPLFCFFAGMVIGFGLIRLSVRLIRADVKWWPGNISRGGLHIHHVVFGVVLMVGFGVANLVIPPEAEGWRAVAAAGFGLGTVLVLDEFALILYLRDVYWSKQGRVSVDALFAVFAVTAMLLVGLHPFVVEELRPRAYDGEELVGPVALVPLAILVGLAALTVLKGKIWTGLLGLFLPFFLIFGAVRLARPTSPWARWRYRPGRRRGERKLERARRRERRLRHPVVEAKIWFQHLIAGTPDQAGADQSKPDQLSSGQR